MSKNICSALWHREMSGSLQLSRPRPRPCPAVESQESTEEEESQSPIRKRPRRPSSTTTTTTPVPPSKKSNNIFSIRMRIDQVIPKNALQAGHIVMGFSHCNRFLLSYTIRPVSALASLRHPQPRDFQNQNRHQFLHQPHAQHLEEFETDSLYTYKLYFWLFMPYKVAKKYSSVLLFDRNGVVDSNLLIQICQWNYDGNDNDRFILVTGRSQQQDENPRCYMSLAQLPPTNPCSNCTYISIDQFQTLSPCPTHSLTLSLTYEAVSPFPSFDPEQSLYLTDYSTPTILINTGNMFHQIQFNPPNPKSSNKSNILKTELNQNHSIPELSYYYENLLPKSEKSERRFFKRFQGRSQGQGQSTEKKPDIYDLNLTNEEDKIDKNYRQFRNRQLADKKYEFVDEYVLRPLHNSNKNKRDSKKTSSGSSKPVYIKKCTARVTRSYVLLNEESVSTTTEIEDNEYNFNEYPIALPTNVYTDQAQLSMIPNYKSVDAKIVVTQTSLDIEMLSNEIANIICNKENVQFVFLIDFDTVVVQTHPIDSSITALVILLIQATSQKDERLKYETNYILQWTPVSQSSKILFQGKLKQVAEKSLEVWNPTLLLKANIEKTRLYQQNNPHLNNQQMVYDWLSVDELQDWEGIVNLYREMIQPNSTDFYDDEDDLISLLSDD